MPDIACRVVHGAPVQGLLRWHCSNDIATCAEAATPAASDGMATAGSPAAASAQEMSPVSAPAPGVLAPQSALAQLQQPLQSPGVQNSQATMVDGMLQLQGQNLWPFTDQTQDALKTALAAAMPAVPQDQIKILETVQASTALSLRTLLLL